MDRVEVKPALLRWARERAGLSTDALARRFPKLDAWGRGELHPTLKRLEHFPLPTYTPVGFPSFDEWQAEPMPPLGHAPVMHDLLRRQLRQWQSQAGVGPVRGTVR